MVLGSTQSITEKNTGSLPGEKGGQRVRLATSLPPVNQFLLQIWQSRRLKSLYASAASQKDSFTFLPYPIGMVAECQMEKKFALRYKS
jgi:hypothetical protein